MIRNYLKIILLFQLFLSPCSASAGESENLDEWVSLPAGAKSAYMGINGGTMPVSLLVSGDGASLVTFVGKTGNDFLDVLRRIYKPFFNIGNSSLPESTIDSKTELYAGNATASMPVVNVPGDLLASSGWLRHMQPFGLSSEPLKIEGQVTKPKFYPQSRKYRFSFLPDFFQPHN